MFIDYFCGIICLVAFISAIVIAFKRSKFIFMDYLTLIVALLGVLFHVKNILQFYNT